MKLHFPSSGEGRAVWLPVCSSEVCNGISPLINPTLELDGADAAQSTSSAFFSGVVSLSAAAEFLVLLGHREELRDARFLRFCEMDRCRFLMEEEVDATVTIQG